MSAAESNATFVTSLYDIGRERWPHFSRSYDSYLRRFSHLLAVEIPLVVFGERILKPLVMQHRKGMTSPTRFVTRPFSLLPTWRHRLRVECVFDSRAFREDNDKLEHPETFSADYLLLMHSKLPLLRHVMDRNPFNTSHFFWIDAGYAAVSDDDTISDVKKVNIPPGKQWRPESLLSLSHAVTYIQLNEPAQYVNVTQLHKRRLSPAMAGGFFGGAQKVMTYYAALYNKCLLKQLTEGELMEDQGTALQVYFEHPSMFNLVKGDWFDAYRLFQ